MRFYLNDNIFIDNGIFYYEYNDKIEQIKEKNWHIYLSEYGWTKLNKRWIIKLNKLIKNKKKNSTFGVLDCGGNGDCLFNCISYAIDKERNVDAEGIRNGLANYITEEKFNSIIEIYKVLKETNDFEESWDPNIINYEIFKDLLKEGGDNYWGDSLILGFLKDFLNINIVVLYNNDVTGEYYHYNMLDGYDRNKNTVLLLYLNDIHFQLVGNFDKNSMVTFFDSSNIPVEILNLVEIR